VALTSAEIARIKFELGDNLLGFGALPFVDVSTVYEQIIAPYTLGGAATTCTATIPASAPAALATLPLASSAGFTAGDRMVVDVDDSQEAATIRSVSGNNVTAFLAIAHSGTFPVLVEGGESIIRGILTQLRKLGVGGQDGGQLGQATGYAGLKRVEDIEFFPDGTGASKGTFATLRDAQAYWRGELATALGLRERLERARSAGRGNLILG